MLDPADEYLRSRSSRGEAARRLLQTSSHDLGHIARSTGFGSVDGMRRAFIRVLGQSPREVKRGGGKAGARL
jgi:transcriptional regulator GlxA family with amidase domain